MGKKKEREWVYKKSKKIALFKSQIMSLQGIRLALEITDLNKQTQRLSYNIYVGKVSKLKNIVN